MNKNEKNKLLVQNVREDFEHRQTARMSLESMWQLNLNFYMGNQYSYIAHNGMLREDEKQYFWQEKEVFNHIAPIIETRASKLYRLNPIMTVIPASTDEADIQSAKVSKNILNTINSKIALTALTKQAIIWSEVCGTAFYKIAWSKELGTVVAKDELGKSIKEGDIEVSLCSPFEIFPDNLSCESINDLKSIIHAKAYSIEDIKEIYGVSVSAERIKSFSLDSASSIGGLGYDATINRIADIELDNHCLVIERYTMPNKNDVDGRLTIIAGDTLLYDGILPYINGEDGGRLLPFIKQSSIFMPGSFFGVSVVDRLIPIQRAYNAMRNRKHEYLNRLSLGVITVEDGSIDTEMLEEEGLSPGKVLIYRQGGQQPTVMKVEQSTDAFEKEESALLEEFKEISGVSDLMTQAYSSYSNMSGTALQVLSEQDDSRLSTSLDSIKDAMKMIGKHILRLYKQFANIPRLLKIAGDNGKVEMYYWNKNEITSDDVVFETNTEIGETIAQKRNMVMELLKNGLLYDEEGKLSQSMRKKCLDLLGFGIWESVQDIKTLHINHAQQENLDMITICIEPSEIDDHELHIAEHISFILGDEFKKRNINNDLKERYIQHINAHKKINIKEN